MAGGQPSKNKMKKRRQHPVLIAEVGCNHQGNIDIARQFIDAAKAVCHVEHIKFQKRNNRELLSVVEYAAPHPVPENAYGESYGAHREHLEFSIEQHQELKNYCEELGMTYSTSVWDVTSLRECIGLSPTYIKVPSATNSNIELLEIACDEYDGQVHLSLGMTTKIEEERVIETFAKKNRLNDLVVYACTSGYPIQPAEACLYEVSRLLELYGDDLHGIGYSGHHNGIALDIAAFTLGASFIERHFTLDRTWKGTDHAASLEPDGLRRLSRNLAQVTEALTYKDEEILMIEKPQRDKLKWKGLSVEIS